LRFAVSDLIAAGVMNKTPKNDMADTAAPYIIRLTLSSI
jgi:hypothetical protein